MSGQKFFYDFNSDRSELHVFDDNSTELQASPVSRNGAWEIPNDIIPVISKELQVELKQNQFSDRFRKIVTVLANPGLITQEDYL